MNIIASYWRPPRYQKRTVPEEGNLASRQVVHKKKKDLDSIDAKCVSCFRWAAHLITGVFVAIGWVLSLPFRVFRSLDSPRESLKLDFRNRFAEQIDKIHYRFKKMTDPGPDALNTFTERVKKFFQGELRLLAKDPDAIRARLAEFSKDPLYIKYKGTTKILRSALQNLSQTFAPPAPLLRPRASTAATTSSSSSGSSSPC